MKKLLTVAINRIFSSTLTRGALVPSLALSLAVVFWTATAPVVKAQEASWGASSSAAKPDKNDKGGDKGNKGGNKGGDKGGGKGGGPPSGKCDICHNPHNYHTISIPCDQVDKFLANHPGDFRGRCQVTGVTNP